MLRVEIEAKVGRVISDLEELGVARADALKSIYNLLGKTVDRDAGRNLTMFGAYLIATRLKVEAGV